MSQLRFQHTMKVPPPPISQVNFMGWVVKKSPVRFGGAGLSW